MRKNILVIDDDDFILSLISAALARESVYDFTCVNNGQEAVDLLDSHKFDLIITDLIMPRMNGIEFIDMIKKSDEDVPIIAISGGDENNSADQYLSSVSDKVSRVLIKPFKKTDLIDAVSAALSLSLTDLLLAPND